MLRTMLALVLALVATVAVASAAVVASTKPAGDQTLMVAMTAQGSHIERMDGYSAARPIALRVDAPRAHGVALVGVGPDGSNLRIPLTRVADGTFAGEVSLALPGVWSLAISSHLGTAETASESFAVTVVEGVSQRALGLVLSLAVALLAGGLALIGLGIVRFYRRPVVVAG